VAPARPHPELAKHNAEPIGERSARGLSLHPDVIIVQSGHRDRPLR